MHEKDSTPIEAIDIESLQHYTETAEAPKNSLDLKPYLWLAFSFLLVCAVSVFFFLPKYVSQKKDPIPGEQVAVTDTPVIENSIPVIEEKNELIPILSAEELSALKKQAEELLLNVIEKQKNLENKAIKKWAIEEYTAALAFGAQGDEYFRKQDFTHAISSYNNAINALDALQLKVAPTLEQHLKLGEEALIKAQKSTAKYHFELAKAIEPSNTQAINGLQRAETIETLYSLLEKGGRYEAANRFNDAKKSYEQATQIDPLSSEAQAALERVDARLKDFEFTRLINAGYAAFRLGQYSDARNAFKSAQQLKPNADQPKQGLKKIQQALFNAKLNTLNAEAEHFENNEDWTNAVATYQQILVLSPKLSSAQQGLELNQTRESILARLNELNANFLRLSSKSVADQATQLLMQTADLNQPGNKITNAAEKLKKNIILANQSITITLQSDEQTDIAIYKVGKFGKFVSQQVDLKPGKYTIVGSRKGYRDVRKVVTVLAEMDDKTFLVQCDEPI